jgi:divalent metal cation (Fe/Co/Zn/Cd) transporter
MLAVLAALGWLPGQYKVPPAEGVMWDGSASVTIGVVPAIVAFGLARSSRELLLGEAAAIKDVEAIRSAIKSYDNVF